VAETKPSARELEAIAPFFFVTDVVKAAAYYRDVLGFTYERLWGNPPRFCMPYREDIVFMLCQAEDKTRIHPNGGAEESWDAHVWVRDADHLFEEFRSKGARIAYEPLTRTLYGSREFAVRDLDGYVIAFGHNIEAKKKCRGMSFPPLQGRFGLVRQAKLREKHSVLFGFRYRFPKPA